MVLWQHVTRTAARMYTTWQGFYLVDLGFMRVGTSIIFPFVFRRVLFEPWWLFTRDIHLIVIGKGTLIHFVYIWHQFITELGSACTSAGPSCTSWVGGLHTELVHTLALYEHGWFHFILSMSRVDSPRGSCSESRFVVLEILVKQTNNRRKR